ncbi:hypothetical protein [Arthrobacter sp. Soil736]|uniref:hypothetical protein n=1 Tax=Arthrobacter sp. Soil736 TaxID=1736395 RepID=UPI0006F8C6F7|nr:hypothetical protein [Arthrobacter sp. Soil736]
MNIQQIEEAAARKLDADREARIAFIRDIASASERFRAARESLAESERKLSQLHRQATTHGWTEADLKGFGIEPNPRNVGGRPRKPKAQRDGAAEAS